MSLPVSDDVETVLHKRFEYLRTIVERPQAKSGLVDTLDTPRSTLDDIVRELEEAGLVEYRAGKWHPTYPGSVACHIHHDYLDHLDSLVDAAPVLACLSPDSELGYEFIADAAVYETNPRVQDAVMTKLLEYVEAATKIRVATPRAVAGFGAQFYQCATAGDEAMVEVVIPEAVHEWFHATYPSAAGAVLEDPKVSVFRAAVPFSFGLSIVDRERAGLTVFTDRGIAGLLVNDTDDALTWAEEQYERVKQDAEQICLRGGVRHASRTT